MKRTWNLALYVAFALMVLFAFMACDRHKAPLEPQVTFVRANVKLDADTVPALQGTKKIKMGEQPILGEERCDAEATSCVVEFSHRWQSGQHDVITVVLMVAESAECAYTWFKQRRNDCAAPLDMSGLEDRPAVAGDVSFRNGRQFIRDNIVVEITADGVFNEKLKAIAMQIDALLLKSPVAKSANQMKPVIDKFEIAQNPVKPESITRLSIQVKDPMKGELYYLWRFTPGSENHGGIEIDQAGNYHYYAETPYSEEELTLLVLNDAGFCACSTICIRIQP